MAAEGTNGSGIALLYLSPYSPLRSFPFLSYFSDWFLGLHKQIHISSISSIIDIIHCARCLSSPHHLSSRLIIVSARPPLLLPSFLGVSFTPRARLHILGGPGDRCGSRANTAPVLLSAPKKSDISRLFTVASPAAADSLTPGSRLCLRAPVCEWAREAAFFCWARDPRGKAMHHPCMNSRSKRNAHILSHSHVHRGCRTMHALHRGAHYAHWRNRGLSFLFRISPQCSCGL